MLNAVANAPSSPTRHLPSPPGWPSDHTERSVPAPSARPPALVSAREVERITGVAAERLRTWERRHGFPHSHGDRRFSVADIPAIVVANQLVESGESVAVAIEKARAGIRGSADLAALTTSLERLDVPVVVYQGPDPLTVTFANRAALREGSTVEVVSEAGNAARRTLQRLAVSPKNEASLVWRPSRSAAHDEERLALAYSLGAPLFVPAVVVVMDLPASHPEAIRSTAGCRAEGLRERRWVRGLSRARRAFQMYPGPAPLQTAFRAMVEEVQATDGFLMFTCGDALHCTLSVRGAMRPAGARAATAERLLARAVAPAWIGPADDRRFAGEHEHLVVPLVAGGVTVGYACMAFEQRCPITDQAEDLLMAFGALMAAGLTRDRTRPGRARTVLRPVLQP